MRRRKFIATSAGVFGISSIAGKIGSRPAIGVDFKIPSKLKESQVTNNNIIVTLSDITIQASNVSDTESDIILELRSRTDASNRDFVLINDYSLDLDAPNETIRIPSLSIDLSTGSDLNYSDSSTAELKLVIKHPDIGTKYTTERFIVPDNIVQDGLVGWWPLHEWSGRANDLSGKNNSGKIVGGVNQGVSGISGLSSYKFNGEDSYVETTGIKNLGDAQTISFWMKSQRPSTETGGDALVELYSNNRTYIRDANGELKFGVWNGDISQIYSPTNSMDYNKWTHWVCWVGNGKMKIYKNGQEVASNTSGPSDVDNYGEQDRFGTLGYTTPDRFYKGNLADIRIYDRALSDSEIKKIYETGNGNYTDDSLHNGTDSRSVSRYTFNSDVTSDEWGRNTLSDNTSAGTTTNAIDNKAKIFDGSNDYMTIGSDVIDYTDGFTFSAWVNGSGADRIISRRNADNTQYEFFIFNRGKGGDGSINFTAENNSYSSGTSLLFDTDGWKHATVTFDNGTLKIYGNGVLLKSYTGVTINSYDSSTDIGAWVQGSDGYYGGYMDDIRIYNRVLNETEVQQLYQWGTKGQDLRERTTTNKSDIEGWWKLNETNGSVAYDSSGNSYDGSINDKVLKGQKSILDGSAYEFNRDGGRVDISGLELPTDQLTITAWVDAEVEKYGDNEYLTIFDKFDDTNKQGVRIIAHAYRDIRAEFEDSGIIYPAGGTGTYNSSNPLSDSGNYNFVVVRYDGTQFKCWVDNELHITYNGSNLTNPSINGVIGNQSDSGWGGSFDGRIDDVRVYNRALTRQEMSYIYEQKF